MGALMNLGFMAGQCSVFIFGIITDTLQQVAGALLLSTILF